MTFAPREEAFSQRSINLAPMIDFLFLMLMFFASLAVTRIATRDTDIDLVEVRPEPTKEAAVGDADAHTIHLSVTAAGDYKWVTSVKDYRLSTSDEIQKELVQQYEKGLLPPDKSKTRVLMRIDREAHWEPILKAIFAVREAGFDVHPVYEPSNEPTSN